jgi:hypothetical protein
MNLKELLPLSFMSSRIPALDALAAFVPLGEEKAPWIAQRVQTWPSRWTPLEGGHRVLILYEGGPYDAARFVVEAGAWDHEHCSRCQATIQQMTLCWVTEGGPFVLLCGDCHSELERLRSGVNSGEAG